MSEAPGSQAPASRKGIGGFVKKNKLLTAGVAGIGAMLYLSNKGQGSTAEGDQAGILLPSVAVPSEASTFDAEAFNRFNDFAEARAQESHEIDTMKLDAQLHPPDVTTPDPSTAVEPEQQPNPTDAPATASGGITVAGKFFSGATGSRASGSGNSAAGHYITQTITYPSRTETWHHYIRDKAGKVVNFWRGPIGGSNPTSSKTPQSSAPSPSPHATPRPSPQPVLPNPTTMHAGLPPTPAGTNPAPPPMKAAPTHPHAAKTRTVSGKTQWFWNDNWHTVPPPSGARY